MKLKKLRKIYRILFPLKLSANQIFVNNLKSNIHIKKFEKVDALYLLTLHNNIRLYLRNENHSDYSVFSQMFDLEEYKSISSILMLNKELDSKETIMIDAGANIGFATVYLSQKKIFDKIICIEPSKKNFEILKRNTDLLKSSIDFFLLEKALASRENVNFNLNNDFRDGKDWSLTTKESRTGNIKGITINEIIKRYSLDEITLLKIDIEGAERFIFEESSDLSFLNKTKTIVIEIHDEFDIREGIYQTLRKNNFLLIEQGELTIAINKKFLHCSD